MVIKKVLFLVIDHMKAYIFYEIFKELINFENSIKIYSLAWFKKI